MGELMNGISRQRAGCRGFGSRGCQGDISGDGIGGKNLQFVDAGFGATFGFQNGKAREARFSRREFLFIANRIDRLPQRANVPVGTKRESFTSTSLSASRAAVHSARFWADRGNARSPWRTPANMAVIR